jgi:hypothetical protein
MNDSDEDLRPQFRALRADDARRAPSFESTLARNSASSSVSSPAHPSVRPRRDQRSHLLWQLGLGTAVAAIALVATQYRPDLSTSQQRQQRQLASHDLPAVQTWTAPSDALLADVSTSDSLETSAHLIGEIDRLLNRTPRHL